MHWNLFLISFYSKKCTEIHCYYLFSVATAGQTNILSVTENLDDIYYTVTNIINMIALAVVAHIYVNRFNLIIV